MPTATREETYLLYQEFFRIAGAAPGDEGYMLEEAVIASRDEGILFPARVRAAVIEGSASYFEASHAEGDDFHAPGLDPWDAWQKFLAAPASDD